MGMNVELFLFWFLPSPSSSSSLKHKSFVTIHRICLINVLLSGEGILCLPSQSFTSSCHYHSHLPQTIKYFLCCVSSTSRKTSLQASVPLQVTGKGFVIFLFFSVTDWLPVFVVSSCSVLCLLSFLVLVFLFQESWNSNSTSTQANASLSLSVLFLVLSDACKFKYKLCSLFQTKRKVEGTLRTSKVKR